MARLLVEIDEDLKTELKVRLLREGETLKSWLTRAARAYVAGGAAAPQARSAPPRAARTKASPVAASVPAAPKKHDFFD